MKKLPLLKSLTIKNRRKQLYRKIAEAREELQNLPKRCPHEDVLFIPDPAGHSDSFYRCNDCGLESSRDPREKR